MWMHLLLTIVHLQDCIQILQWDMMLKRKPKVTSLYGTSNYPFKSLKWQYNNDTKKNLFHLSNCNKKEKQKLKSPTTAYSLAWNTTENSLINSFANKNKWNSLQMMKSEILHLKAMASLRQITVTFDPSKTIQMASKFSTALPLILVTWEANLLNAQWKNTK